jgi:TolA-binding protein
VLGALVVAPASADRIYRTSGATIEDCTIVDETLDEVSYKEGGRGKDLSVPSDEVLRVEYERVPPMIGEAIDFLEGDELASALGAYRDYVDGHLSGDKEEKRYKWAPAYAAFRVLEMEVMGGDPSAVIAAADRLLQNFPESRYVPRAYVAVADALHQAGKAEQAQAKLAEFERLILKKNLSQRWGLECRLAQALTSASLAGDARRERLLEIEKDASGDFPTVKNRAAVARGEAFLEEVGPRSNGKGVEALRQAREIFEKVAADPSSDDLTLAGAYAGLGECIFQSAASSKDAAEVTKSLLAFMRVVVVYKDQTRYVPKSMFYAGRCWNLLGGVEDDERANKLYGRVMRDYPETKWAQEARNFRK